MGDDGDAGAIADVRSDFLKEYTMRTLGVKNDKWSKMINVEDSLTIIEDWLNKKDTVCLVIANLPSGGLTPTGRFLELNF